MAAATAAMTALQSSMTSLSISSNSFLGQRFSPITLSPLPSPSPMGNVADVAAKWFRRLPKPQQCGLNCDCKPHFKTLSKTIEKQCPIVMKIKHWERKKCKPNSLPILHKMHVKLGDTVKIISGHEKGKVGEISKVFKHNSTVIVKDLNLKTKHVKSREEGEPGQIIKIEGPIHSSNVMLYSKDQNVASRVGHKVLENGKRVRYLIKTGEIIDNAENWKKLKEDTKKTEEVAAA